MAASVPSIITGAEYQRLGMGLQLGIQLSVLREPTPHNSRIAQK
jgi:hypothetical protein